VQTHKRGDTAPNDERSWASRHKSWLIGGAVVVAAAIIVTGVLLGASRSGHSDKTDITPMVSF
jgi:hypothetical protein